MKSLFFHTYRNWSIRRKLLVIISLLIVLSVTLVSVLSYRRYTDYFTEQTKEQTQQIIDQISINVDTYLKELLRLSLTPYYNNSIMEELEFQPHSDMEKLEKQRNIENYLGSVMILPRDDILRVYILTDSDVYSSIKTPYNMEEYLSYTQSSWFLQARRTQERLFLPVHSEKVFGNKKTQIFSFVQSLRSKEDNSKVLGVIKVDANYAGIKNICDKVQLESDSALFIIDKDKNIIYQNSRFADSKLSDSIYQYVLATDGSSIPMIDGAKYVVNTSTLSTTDWKIAKVSSYNQLNRYFLETRNAAFVAALLCAAAAVFVLVLFANNFLNPIFTIVRRMRQVQEGDLSAQVPVKSHDEIGFLTESFNTMVSQLRKTMQNNTLLVKKVYESRYLQKEAQYSALCSQIKPHFLYNTLNTISLLIKCGEQDEAVHNIEDLSYFLRGVMNTDKDIPLYAELKLVDAYLSLQKNRYKDQFSYQINIPKDFSNFEIPALTLQPIVENAIIHGCEMKRGNSVIQIHCSVEDDCFIIFIEDNGRGMEESQVKELNDMFHSTPLQNRDEGEDILNDSIGLINVNSRLQLKFGINYGISINSKIGKGTRVSVRLPYTAGREN
ncbi:MAG: Two-component system, sensor histidine kinase YesM [Oscillospiraceae bacterium]|jgi:two-component system, sensor histidine kinase YesM